MRLRVLYHGNCFDGCSSAGLFARFYRERIAKGRRSTWPIAPLEHKGAGPAIPADLFDGDDNVCVDFRYSQDPRLNWWFDHHVSAFQAPGDEAHFRADTSGQKFYDPAARSCARFLARTRGREVRLRHRAGGRADRVGRDHRRRAVPQRPRCRSS